MKEKTERLRDGEREREKVCSSNKVNKKETVRDRVIKKDRERESVCVSKKVRVKGCIQS